ncbi:unnamed protein product [Clonostachys byssicola]|uniref:Uncharacterized protein n=1 Tax=Clonostachys byssicola TaxID=160290 RepID=A0A9N9UMC4_9HYPO|nr:unnamed protein product [Clonostachys byssicola]
MITEDAFSAADAVDETVALTKAAASEAASSPKTNGYDALWIHADTVTALIIALGSRLPHSEQSKLVDFTVRLGQDIVSHPTNGTVLRLKEPDDAQFWTGMPRLAINLAEVWLRNSGVTSEDESRNQDFVNLSAFYAQLAEVKFQNFQGDISWSLPRLTCMFDETRQVTRQDVRVACMWLIYAPKKVLLDVQLRRKENRQVRFNQFKPEFWPQWKQFLQDCQQKPSSEISDKETQDLITKALDSMGKAEAAAST